MTMTIHKDKDGNPSLVSIVCPPPTRRDILRRTVRLELSMRDAEWLSYELSKPLVNAQGLTDYPRRKRIMKQLEEEIK